MLVVVHVSIVESAREQGSDLDQSERLFSIVASIEIRGGHTNYKTRPRRAQVVGILGWSGEGKELLGGRNEAQGMTNTRFRSLCLSGFLGLCLLSTASLAEPVAAPLKLRLQPPAAQLWTQTSAEYRASAIQTYRLAEMQLDRWSRESVKGRDGKARRKGSDKPLAIILDLDETVIDNIGFQVYGTTQAGFRSADFDAWVEFQATHEPAILGVPGAVRFLKKAEAAGVTPIYISNRLESGTASTIEVLRKLGVGVSGIQDRLLLSKGDGDRKAAEAWLENKRVTGEFAAQLLDGEGRKELRRRQVAEKYEVVGYFGDQLGDFDPYVRAEPNGKGGQKEPNDYASRQARADQNDARWGTEWFVLPNPMYGGWGPTGDIPEQMLVNLRPALTDFGFTEWLKQR